MGKLSKHHQNGSRRTAQLKRLHGERRKLTARLAMVDARISKVASTPGRIAKLSMAEFDRWLEQLAEGSDRLPSLPADLSRADIYGDHD